MMRIGILISIMLCPSIATFADMPRNQALHVTMRDGVRIAIDVWLPADIESDTKLPTLVHATRYWRALEGTQSGIEHDNRFAEAERVNNAGYALVLVDARGSGASFGWRAYERSVAEATDYGEVVDWIISQPWSSGLVGAYGVSYAGNTAELLLTNRHPAVKAVAPLFNDFDNFTHLAFPGGALTAGNLGRWGNRVNIMDQNDICGVRGLTGDECETLKKEWTGVKRVDNDIDGELLRQATAEHARNVHPFEAALKYEFRDDPWGPPDGVRDAGFLGSPAGHLDDIEASGTPMFVRAGWQDAATINGTLGRFMTIDNTQVVTIGPWDHGARRDADPFHPVDTPVAPSPDQQFAEMIAFFDHYLQPDSEGSDTRMSSSIRYYTLGADRWSDTPVWPPEGFEEETWYFGADNKLTRSEPASDRGADAYNVDFDATTGRHNRWWTNNGGGGDVVYGDRAAADEKLLTFTSEPFAVDTEITGHPIIELFVSSTHTDGLFIAYLEDVAPDGRVTYITEGQLRALTRKTPSAPPPYKKLGPHRSELRADAMPLVAGEVTPLKFELWATSVLIRQGHQLRIAIAGADKDTFLRYPRDGGEPTITVQRNSRYPTNVILPVRRLAGDSN